MKVLFAILISLSSANVFADESKQFGVYTYATIEDNVEPILDSSAAASCRPYQTKRVSPIQSNYRPYRYYIRAWATYVCVLN